MPAPPRPTRIILAVLLALLAGACTRRDDPTPAPPAAPVPVAVEGTERRLDRVGGLELVFEVETAVALGERMRAFGFALERHLAQSVFSRESDPGELAQPIAEVRTHAEFAYPSPGVLLVTTAHEGLRTALADPELLPVEGHDDITIERTREAPTTFRFRITPESGEELARRVLQRVADIARRRLEAYGVMPGEFEVRARAGGGIVVQLVGQRGDDAAKLARRLAQRAELAFRVVDDESDYFGEHAADIRRFFVEYPREAKMLELGEPDPPGGSAPPGRVTIRGDDEASVRALRRWLIDEGKVPDDHLLAWTAHEDYREPSKRQVSYSLLYLHREPVVSGRHIRSAELQLDTVTSEPFVALAFDAMGARRFATLTRDFVRKRLAIQLDEEVTSAPQIREEIAGGRARITLGSSHGPRTLHEEARALADTLAAGAYPAPLDLTATREVAPAGTRPDWRDRGALLGLTFGRGEAIAPEHLHALLAPALSALADGVAAEAIEVHPQAFVDVEDTGQLRFVVYVPGYAGKTEGAPLPRDLVGEALGAAPTLASRLVEVQTTLYRPRPTETPALPEAERVCRAALRRHAEHHRDACRLSSAPRGLPGESLVCYAAVLAGWLEALGVAPPEAGFSFSTWVP